MAATYYVCAACLDDRHDGCEGDECACRACWPDDDLPGDEQAEEELPRDPWETE